MSPSFDTNILSTRFALTADERTVVQMELNDEHTRLLRIENEIERLCGQRNNLLLSTAIYEELLSPMRRLSPMPEILEHIFFFCLPDRNITSNTVSEHDAPLVLLRVCRRWHDVAVRSPWLWTNLKVTFGSSETRLDPAKIIRSWMQNVGSLPFSIEAWSSGWKSGGRLAVPVALEEKKALDPVMHKFSQCRAFTFWGEPGLLERLFPPYGMRDARNLRGLKVMLYPTSQFGKVPSISSIDAPNLRNLICTPFMLPKLPSSFGSLRYLGIMSQNIPQLFSQSQLVSILESCPDLEELFVFLRNPRSPDTPDVRIELAALHSLHVSWHPYTDPIHLLSAIRVPGLRRLHLKTYRERSLPSSLGPALNSLFMHSSPPVTHVVLTNLVSFDQKFGPWISGMRELQSLHVEGGSFSRGCLRDLTPDNGGDTPWPCPKLTHVTFSGTRLRPGAELLPFLRSRTLQTGVPAQPHRNYLKYVRVDFSKGLLDEEEEELKALEETCEDLELIVTRFKPTRASSEEV